MPVVYYGQKSGYYDHVRIVSHPCFCLWPAYLNSQCRLLLPHTLLMTCVRVLLLIMGIWIQVPSTQLIWPSMYYHSLLACLWDLCFWAMVFVYSLDPGQMYYYMFGDTYGWSKEYNFTAAPYHGPNTTIRVIAYGGSFPCSLSFFISLLCDFIVSRYGLWRDWW